MSKTRPADGMPGASPSTPLQLSGRKNHRTLLSLRKGETGILDAIDLPPADARRLMELGFLPGAAVTAGQSAPGGDPRVFQVDGSEIALRRSTAVHVTLRPEPKRKM